MKKIPVILLSILILFTACQPNTQNGQSETENSKFIATWFTYQEIGELSEQCATEEELTFRINEIFKEFKKFKINNLFLHARAFDDSYYSSSRVPSGLYCRDGQGNLKYDVLQHFINIGKEYKVRIHAWINPYRIRNHCDVEKLDKNSFASEILDKNSADERIIITDTGIFYNPAYTDVQNYVLSCVREILENYDVDGIHLDDYFYPTTSKDIDEKIYGDFLNNGGTMLIDEFRRNAVNSLISSIYSLAKNFNNEICVSISPSADIENNYSKKYADVKLWADNEGYADVLIPQIYYGYEHSTMPFDELLNEWSELNNQNIKIAIGLPLYKSGKTDVYAGEGENEWCVYNNIISRQINSIIEKDLNGWSYFSAAYIYNTYGEFVNAEKENILNAVNN